MQPSRTKLARRLAAGLFVVGAASIALSYSFIINNQDPAPSGTGLPIKWPAGPIVMKVMADNTTMLSDGTTRATAIVAAMTDAQRGWNQYLGDVQFSPQILPAGNGTDGNNVNEVFFSNSPYGKSWDSNTLAVTTVWSIGNQRAESDTIFNTAFTWDSYRGPLRNGVTDIQRVALHEFGHNLGLDHPDDAGESVPAVMNSHESNTDSLQADDIAGAQRLYGPPGTPANDNFANAIAITLGSGNTAKVTGYSTNATKELGEPNHAGNIGGRSVWWKWTAPSAGNVTVNTGQLTSSGMIDVPSSENATDTTYDNSSTFDTTLGVYTGSSVSSLTTIASNDDIKDGVIQVSSLTFNATAGTTYYFAVDGYNPIAQDPTDKTGADSGGVTLNLSQTPTGAAIPVITAQPVGVTVTTGGTASFTVTATGATSYQWQFNGNNISGATSATYTISNAQVANAGTYSVTVSNNAGSVVSNNATLTVNTPPPPPPPPSSGSGGGGGGAPSLWFLLTLGAAGLARVLRRR
jgi:hypothetical protein